MRRLTRSRPIPYSPESVFPGLRHTDAIRHKGKHHILNGNPFNTQPPMHQRRFQKYVWREIHIRPVNGTTKRNL